MAILHLNEELEQYNAHMTLIVLFYTGATEHIATKVMRRN